jgi:hypothetical protein
MATLILVSNRKEKFYFVVKQSSILGYSVDEVMGMLDVTEDEEFIGENFMKILF